MEDVDEKSETFQIKHGVEGDEDPATVEARRRCEKSLVRKLDMTLLPLVWILYMFNYLDRNNIAYGFLFLVAHFHAIC